MWQSLVVIKTHWQPNLVRLTWDSFTGTFFPPLPRDWESIGLNIVGGVLCCFIIYIVCMAMGNTNLMPEYILLY